MAGDLMFAHAEYHSTYPLPVCGTIFGKQTELIEPPKSAVRKVTFARDDLEDFTDESYVEKEKAKRAPVQKPDTLARYVAVLSKQEWTSSRDISRALHINVNAANRYLSTYKEMFEKRHEMRRTGLSNLWKLKCAPA